MTKYSIKIRRNSLTKGSIESHKDFKALQQMSVKKQSSGNLTKLLVIIIALILLIAMTLFGVQKINENSSKKEPVETPDIYDEFKH